MLPSSQAKDRRVTAETRATKHKMRSRHGSPRFDSMQPVALARRMTPGQSIVNALSDGAYRLDPVACLCYLLQELAPADSERRPPPLDAPGGQNRAADDR